MSRKRVPSQSMSVWERKGNFKKQALESLIPSQRHLPPPLDALHSTGTRKNPFY